MSRTVICDHCGKSTSRPHHWLEVSRLDDISTYDDFFIEGKHFCSVKCLAIFCGELLDSEIRSDKLWQ